MKFDKKKRGYTSRYDMYRRMERAIRRKLTYACGAETREELLDELDEIKLKRKREARAKRNDGAKSGDGNK